MQTQWYGDKRDVVKWATLIHLCKKHGLSTIIQVLFLNDAKCAHKLRVDERPQDFPESVLCHFWNLSHIEALGTTERLLIHMVGGEFNHGERRAYMNKVCKTVKRHSQLPKVVLLDPDTGIAPSKPTARHVIAEDIRQVWRHLKRGDWLVLYQHAPHQKDWQRRKKKIFARACGGATVRICDCETIARDVVFFCAERKA